jgi:hypothetical protein
MTSMSFCCTDACTVSVSVMVRFRMLGRLDGGGDVLAVVPLAPLSFVGVLDELSEPVLSPDGGCGRESAAGTEASCRETAFSIVMGGGAGAVGDMRGVLSMGSGLAVLKAKPLSNMFAFDVVAGPVNGPVRMSGSPLGRFPAPTKCAFANRSSIFWASTSPVTRAWALAIPAFDETDHAILSRINSMDRFRTF